MKDTAKCDHAILEWFYKVFPATGAMDEVCVVMTCFIQWPKDEYFFLTVDFTYKSLFFFLCEIDIDIEMVQTCSLLQTQTFRQLFYLVNRKPIKY